MALVDDTSSRPITIQVYIMEQGISMIKRHHNYVMKNVLCTLERFTNDNES